MNYRIAQNKTRGNNQRRKDNISGEQEMGLTFSKSEEISGIDEVDISDAKNKDEYANESPEISTDSGNENGKIEGDEQDMEYRLSLLAQMCNPHFSQRIQQCCHDIDDNYSSGDINIEANGTDDSQVESEEPNAYIDTKKRDNNWATADRSINGEGEDPELFSNFDCKDEESCGEEEDMKHCLLLFAQVLYPKFAQYLQECYSICNSLSTDQTEAEEVKEELSTSMESTSNEQTDESNAQISDSMAESATDKSTIGECDAVNEDSRVSNEDEYNDEIYGSEEDMKHCLLLIAQMLFPRYAQFLQRCCGSSNASAESGSEEDTESKGIVDSQGDGEMEKGELDADTEAIADQSKNEESSENGDDTVSESYGNEEDMKQCLLLLTKMLFPQFAKCFQLLLGNDNSNSGDRGMKDDRTSDDQMEELESDAVVTSKNESADGSSEWLSGICYVEETEDRSVSGEGAENEGSDVHDVNIEGIDDESEVDDKELKQCLLIFAKLLSQDISQCL